MTVEHLPNRVLAALGHTDLTRCREHLERISLSRRHTLLSLHAPIEFVYFPENALVGLWHPGGPDGAAAPVALVGCDGVVGVAPLLGAADATLRAEVLHPGYAWRLPVAVLGREPAVAAGLMRLALRYLQALNAQMSQAALCRLQHTPSQRLCRWLQDAFDRVPDTTLRIELSDLGAWLGAEPEALAQHAAQLVAEGAIALRDRSVTLLDREPLARRSCGCHRQVKQQTDQLFLPLA